MNYDEDWDEYNSEDELLEVPYSDEVGGIRIIDELVVNEGDTITFQGSGVVYNVVDVWQQDQMLNIFFDGRKKTLKYADLDTVNGDIIIEI